MPASHSFSFSLRTLTRATFISLSRKTALTCSLAGCLLLPTGLQAEEIALAEIEPMAELALHQPQAASSVPGEIRMTLYGLKNWRVEDTPAKAQPSLDISHADEVKKQAQARYLAAKFKKQESTLREYVDLAWAEAGKRKLNPELLIAIIQKESSFRPKVQSRYGAQGLMQVVPRWHREKLKPSESLFDPEVNIRVGADVLEEYLAQANGNMDQALRKYSGNSRNYVNNIKKESRALARVAEQAAG